MYTYLPMFLFQVVICNSLINYGISLKLENIIGGRYAEEHSIKYQVVIESKQNFSYARTIVCGGSIVAYNLVITAAHCFFVDNVFQYLSYSIIADSINLKSADGIRIDIDKIYIPYYNETSTVNDIAGATLKESLNLYKNPNLKALKLPKSSDILIDKIGKVSGYGLIWVRTRVNPETAITERASGAFDFLLKYASVRIISNKLCKESYKFVFSDLQFCGLMIADFPGEIPGICSGDSGGPLVINDTLVGVISRNQANCDDSVTGCIYTRVSAYTHIIHNFILGLPEAYADIYHNSPHIL